MFEPVLSNSTRTMKWVSIAALLSALVWRSSPDHQVFLQFVVFASAILVAIEATRSARYFWAAGFGATALLYNPIVPVALSRNIFLILACLTLFALSLAALKTRPLLSPLLLARSRTSRTTQRTTVSWS